MLFIKFAGSLIGPADDIALPPESRQVDYEAELVVVVGRAGRRITREDALDHVLGYTVANDVTMRDYQYKTHQWLQGKAWDRSTPLGRGSGLGSAHPACPAASRPIGGTRWCERLDTRWARVISNR